MIAEHRVAIIVAARMGSTRLPGKCLEDLGGKPLIEQLLLRLRRSRHADKLVLATTTREEDAVFDEFSALADVFHGDENDLIKRHLDAAKGFELIVRVTGDNPFTDPAWVDRALEEHVRVGPALTSTRHIAPDGSVIRSLPKGLSIDVLSYEHLAAIHEAPDLTPADREHVIPYFFSHPEQHPVHLLPVPESLRRPELCLSVDTRDDLLLARTIARAVNMTTVTLEELYALLDRHPGWRTLNS